LEWGDFDANGSAVEKKKKNEKKANLSRVSKWSINRISGDNHLADSEGGHSRPDPCKHRKKNGELKPNE